ncbi:hypothetical protein Adt_35293 [Abeliophyllum distichum]|uniref:Uncharacterized protein n=1 Tax=Abeliophyllum distichum TaxID=126358 RepID=A0ABD1QEB1_9LAMI
MSCKDLDLGIFREVGWTISYVALSRMDHVYTLKRHIIRVSNDDIFITTITIICASIENVAKRSEEGSPLSTIHLLQFGRLRERSKKVKGLGEAKGWKISIEQSVALHEAIAELKDTHATCHLDEELKTLKDKQLTEDQVELQKDKAELAKVRASLVEAGTREIRSFKKKFPPTLEYSRLITRFMKADSEQLMERI